MADADSLILLAGAVIGFPILAYAIGAILHIYIDNRHGAALVTRYFNTTKAQIIEPLKTEIMTEIAALRTQISNGAEISLPEGQVAKEFESFLRSPAGVQWASELAKVAADNVTDTMVQKATSIAGGAARTAQARLVQLIDAQLDFGNPIMNGIWASVPRANKAQFFNGVAKILRRTGFALVPVNGGAAPGSAENVIEGDYNLEDLTDGNEHGIFPA